MLPSFSSAVEKAACTDARLRTSTSRAIAPFPISCAAFFGRSHIDIRNGDRYALPCERLCDGKTDAGTASGKEGTALA